MQVQLGNALIFDGKDESGRPVPLDLGYPSVTYLNVPDHLPFDPAVDIAALKAHMVDSVINNGGVTHFENAEAILAVAHIVTGAWPGHSPRPPTWVACDENPQYAAALATWYGCPVGAPADVEQTHITRSGPPGAKMSPGPTMMLVNTGRDRLDQLFLGGTQLAYAGTATATAATSITATGTPWGVNAYANMMVSTPTGFAMVISNTSSVATLDRWYAYATPGAAAAATPGATTTFQILNGGPGAIFMGVSTTNSASVLTDTTMVGEIANGAPAGETNIAGTLPSGFVRQIGTYAHTAGATTSTVTGVFTANAADNFLPFIVYRMNLSISIMISTVTFMVYETLTSSSATISIIGDQLTVTETITSV